MARSISSKLPRVLAIVPMVACLQAAFYQHAIAAEHDMPAAADTESAKPAELEAAVPVAQAQPVAAAELAAPAPIDAAKPASEDTVAEVAASKPMSFRGKLEHILQNHPLIKATEADVESTKFTIKAERSSYLPRASFTITEGYQDINREQGTSGKFHPTEKTVMLNQLISDFGLTAARVTAANKTFTKAEREKSLQGQNLMLAAVEAQLGVIRAHAQLRYATESESYVKKQTQLESGRLEAGRGYATDVLQAKAQLAGAEARRVVAERQLQEALNRYEAVFRHRPDDLTKLEGLVPAHALLPKNEAEMLEWVSDTANPDLMLALARTDSARAEREVQRTREYMPRLELQAQRSRWTEMEGSLGKRDDTRLTLRFNWNYDLGGRADAVTQAAEAGVTSAMQRAAHTRLQAVEEARNAWVALYSARERSAFLVNQVVISQNFLNLARKERELGRRSLLDLLNGETALINAQSDAVTARVDEVIATYRVLRAVGRFNPSVFELPGIIVPSEQLSRFESIAEMEAPAPKK